MTVTMTSDRRPRILQVVADGRAGGGTSHVLDLAQGLRAAGVDSRLVTANGSFALHRARELGIPASGVPFSRGRFDPGAWLLLKRALADAAPDLVHAHGARAGLPLSFLRGPVPLVYTVHGYHFPAKSPWLRRLAVRAERRCSASAAVTVFVCEHDRGEAGRFGVLSDATGWRVIPNGVETPPEPAPGSPDHPPKAVFLGRLVPQKNPLLLLDIAERLRGSGIRLLVAGDGPFEPDMRAGLTRRKLAEDMTLLGALPRADALEVLRGATALLLPSRWEGLPIAALEAMAAGVPVVASPVGGLTEAIEHDRSGFLIDPPTAEGFAATVLQLAREPDLRDRIVREARATVARRFTWRRTLDSHLELYRSVLGSDQAGVSPPPSP